MDIVIPILIVAVIGLIAGIVLTVAAKLMHVSVNEKVEQIRDELPGANCGACGFAGCDDYASALVTKEGVSTSACPVGGAYLSIAIARILGVESETAEPKIATVLCRGSSDAIRRVMKHDKEWSCRAATQLYGGQMECRYGCLGLGDCVQACPHDAIKIVNRLAVVEKEACVGCGLCEKACPKNVIEMREESKRIYIACKSLDTGLFTMKACEEGCIGCKRCVDVCRFDAIKVENNLAKIDYDKCKMCGMCVKECITGAIIDLRKKQKKQ